MSKRFTDSYKFRDTWYRKLSPIHKCLWEYMLSECSCTGILELDFESISFHIGAKIKKEDLKDFEQRIYFISENLIFIPKFLFFQQPNGLNENNNAHKGIIEELKKYGLPIEYSKIKDLLGTDEELRRGLGAASQLPCNGNSKGNSKGNSNNNKQEDSTLDSKNCTKKSYGEFQNVLLTDDEYQKLFNIYYEKLDEAIEFLSSSIKSKGYKYSSHYAVMGKTKWVYKEIMEKGRDKLSPPFKKDNIKSNDDVLKEYLETSGEN